MRRSTIMPTLIAHGGAGGRPPVSDRASRRTAILAAVKRGAEILRGGGAALDAVVATVVALENDPLFNAGYGSVLTVAGRVEMDAAVMTATRVRERPIDRQGDDAETARLTMSSVARRRVAAVDVRAGGVVLVSRVRNPIELARAVMEQTPHLLIGGAGAEALARQSGLRMCRPTDLISQRARERWLASRGEPAGHSAAANSAGHWHGTVGAVAVDSHGDIAAATSTGGVSGKLPGRIGDSAIVGAGLFAAAGGGASATGEGEAIMRIALCREAVTFLTRLSAQAAAERAIAILAEATTAQAGLILVDSGGGLGYAHNAEVMEIALFHPLDGIRHQVLEPLPLRASPSSGSRK
jgi:isoaspartyl peptidase/L-asparaginase-like protein (Ntn-hydrolase superfamily)